MTAIADALKGGARLPRFATRWLPEAAESGEKTAPIYFWDTLYE